MMMSCARCPDAIMAQVQNPVASVLNEELQTQLRLICLAVAGAARMRTALLSERRHRPPPPRDSSPNNHQC